MAAVTPTEGLPPLTSSPTPTPPTPPTTTKPTTPPTTQPPPSSPTTPPTTPPTIKPTTSSTTSPTTSPTISPTPSPTTSPTPTPPTTSPPANSITNANTPPTISAPVTPTTSPGTTLVAGSGLGGGVVTTTSLVAFTPSLPASTSATSESGTSKGFFQNTGAVAGTFTVVGLVALGLLIYLITTLLRRRRAARFDREVDEAAAEAAAAPAPIFLDDDLSDNGHRYGGGVYSDASSHGTYAQPAMNTEAYGMREMQPQHIHGGGYDYDPYAAAVSHPRSTEGYGGVYANNNTNANAAAGVSRARSTEGYNGYTNQPNNVNSNAAPGAYGGNDNYQDSGNAYIQYPAVAAPTPAPKNANHHDGYYRGPGSPEHELLEAAGMGGGVARGMSLNHAAYATANPGQAQELQRGTSQESSTHQRQHPYAAQSHVVHEEEEDAYGGYVDEGPAPAHRGYVQEHAGDERGSYYDAQVPRVLKIANE